MNEAIRLNPEFALHYLIRGNVHYELGNFDMAPEDYDNAVRLCPDYETDFVDCNFAHGGKEAVEAAIKFLDYHLLDYPTPPESATEFYYYGVRTLFTGHRLNARRYFERARELGFHDLDKIEKHLENLRSRS